MKFERITKRQAQHRFATGLEIILCPCKMRVGGPWHVEFHLYPKSIKKHKEDAEMYKDLSSSLWKGEINKTAWDLMYNNWSSYNTNYEMGYYAHFYIKIP